MITAVFSLQRGCPCGVAVTGHSGWDAAGRDIVCSAVSSAVLLTANTLTARHPDWPARCEDGVLTLSCGDDPMAARLLGGLRVHLAALAKQYPRTIRVMNCNWNGGNTHV